MVSPNIHVENVILTAYRWEATKTNLNFFAAAQAEGDLTDDM
jgi:hypothetical protein